MTLPNFLIIGAAKSGTTSLNRYLSDHPQIYMSLQKELHYFSYPETHLLTNGPDSYHRITVGTLEEYESFFKDVTDQVAIGDSSPSYLYFSQSAQRIKNTIPNVKLIAILRNPVDRAYSCFMHAVRDRWETVRTFEEGLALEEERIAAGWEMVWHYTKAGFYANQLKDYFNCFPREQLKIFLYEDLERNAAGMMREIHHHIGVDENYKHNLTVRANQSGKVKSREMLIALNWLGSSPNPLRLAARTIFPERTRWRFMQKLRGWNLKQECMSEKTRKKLTSLFKEDIIRTQELIGRDLTPWIDVNNQNYA